MLYKKSRYTIIVPCTMYHGIRIAYTNYEVNVFSMCTCVRLCLYVCVCGSAIARFISFLRIFHIISLANESMLRKTEPNINIELNNAPAENERKKSQVLIKFQSKQTRRTAHAHRHSQQQTLTQLTSTGSPIRIRIQMRKSWYINFEKGN